MLSLLAVDIAHANIPPAGFENLTQEACIGEAILHDGAETVKAQVYEVVVLGNNLSSGTGEVEGVRFFSASEVMKLEDEVLGKIGLIAPDDPTNAGVYQPKLMARSVN